MSCLLFSVGLASVTLSCHISDVRVMLQTQVDNEASRAKEAFYQQALQDLTLFKSKTNAALLQVCSTGTPCPVPGHMSGHFVNELTAKVLTPYRALVRTVHTWEDTKFIQTRNNIQ